ncbi:hypothetical protein D3C77_494030 [compost metagenome]
MLSGLGGLNGHFCMQMMRGAYMQAVNRRIGQDLLEIGVYPPLLLASKRLGALLHNIACAEQLGGLRLPDRCGMKRADGSAADNDGI